jgi:hypothetical protein
MEKCPPINDNFPFAEGITERHDMPEIPTWNGPPIRHVKEKTPLLIEFTRNWPMLQQSVVSYITAGWPREDIYVVDNTGTWKSNFPPGKLSPQHPHYFDVQRLQDVFGVSVISTPTLLSFTQLQNFYISTALERSWDYFWWSHSKSTLGESEFHFRSKRSAKQKLAFLRRRDPPSITKSSNSLYFVADVIALSEEKYGGPGEGAPFRSLYMHAVDKFRETTSPDYLRNKTTGEKPDWAIQFFGYEGLALNNVKSFMKVGGWDTFMSHYLRDCDMHKRPQIEMSNITMPRTDAGRILDVGGSIDLNLLFRRKIDPENPPRNMQDLERLPEDERGGRGYEELIDAIQLQMDVKTDAKYREHGRSSSQDKKQGGQSEPFCTDPEGLEQALEVALACGGVGYLEMPGETCYWV